MMSITRTTDKDVHVPTKTVNTAPGHHSDTRAFDMLDGLQKNILNFELLEDMRDVKERDYQVIPLGHFIY